MATSCGENLPPAAASNSPVDQHGPGSRDATATTTGSTACVSITGHLPNITGIYLPGILCQGQRRPGRPARLIGELGRAAVTGQPRIDRRLYIAAGGLAVDPRLRGYLPQARA